MKAAVFPEPVGAHPRTSRPYTDRQTDRQTDKRMYSVSDTEAGKGEGSEGDGRGSEGDGRGSEGESLAHM